MSWKLCFPTSATARRACACSTLTKQSFADNGITKQELGNEETLDSLGDGRRGQRLVVWAFNEGRGAARECDRFLMGATDLP